jgi:hypothetical protein
MLIRLRKHGVVRVGDQNVNPDALVNVREEIADDLIRKHQATPVCLPMTRGEWAAMMHDYLKLEPEADFIAKRPVAGIYGIHSPGDTLTLPLSVGVELAMRGDVVFATSAQPGVALGGAAAVDHGAIADAGLRAAVASLKKASAGLGSKVAELNAAIEAAYEKLRLVEMTPVRREDFLAAMRWDLTAETASFRDFARGTLADVAKERKDFLTVNRVETGEGRLMGSTRFLNPRDFGWFLFACGEAFVVSLEPLLAKVDWPSNARPYAELKAEASSLRDQIASLTAERDALVQQLHAAGVVPA